MFRARHKLEVIGVDLGRMDAPVGGHDGHPGREPATSEPGVLTEFLAGRLHSP